jgi:hypothetical protein
VSENSKINAGGFRAPASAALVVLVCSLLAWGAVTGRISGTVKDPGLPGARRTIFPGPRRIGFGKRSLEFDRVDRTGSLLPPSNREMSGYQQAAFRRQGSFQMVEKLPQIRPRLRFARCRPQQKGQSFARLQRIAMQDQICDQRVEAVRVDSRYGTPLEADPQVAKQVDPHGSLFT